MDNLPDTQAQIPRPQVQPTVQIIQTSFFQTTHGKVITILAGVLILATTMFMLNYLSPYPSPLPFLPKKQTQTSTTKQSTNYTPATTTPSLSSHEEKQIYQSAQSFIDTILQPKYRKKLTLKEFLFSDGKETVPFPSFVDSWETASVSSKLSVQYDFEKRKITNIDLSLLIPHVSNIPTSSVNNILSPYILASEFNITCDPPNLAGNVICSSMLISNIDESRTGISFRSYPGQKEDIITLCQIFPGSNTYSWNYCLSP